MNLDEFSCPEFSILIATSFDPSLDFRLCDLGLGPTLARVRFASPETSRSCPCSTFCQTLCTPSSRQRGRYFPRLRQLVHRARVEQRREQFLRRVLQLVRRDFSEPRVRFERNSFWLKSNFLLRRSCFDRCRHQFPRKKNKIGGDSLKR